MEEKQKCCPLWGDVEKAPVPCGGNGCQWWNESSGCCLCAIPDMISGTNTHMEALSETLTGITTALDSVVDALKALSEASEETA